VPDAKRTENLTSLPWRAQPDSLWGHLTYSLVQLKKENKLHLLKSSFINFQFIIFCYNLSSNYSYFESLHSDYHGI